MSLCDVCELIMQNINWASSENPDYVLQCSPCLGTGAVCIILVLHSVNWICRDNGVKERVFTSNMMNPLTG